MLLKVLNPKLEWACQLPVEALERLFKPVSDLNSDILRGKKKKNIGRHL